jgi:hypothetical protein
MILNGIRQIKRLGNKLYLDDYTLIDYSIDT